MPSQPKNLPHQTPAHSQKLLQDHTYQKGGLPITHPFRQTVLAAAGIIALSLTSFLGVQSQIQKLPPALILEETQKSLKEFLTRKHEKQKPAPTQTRESFQEFLEKQEALWDAQALTQKNPLPPEFPKTEITAETQADFNPLLEKTLQTNQVQLYRSQKAYALQCLKAIHTLLLNQSKTAEKTPAQKENDLLLLNHISKTFQSYRLHSLQPLLELTRSELKNPTKLSKIPCLDTLIKTASNSPKFHGPNL